MTIIDVKTPIKNLFIYRISSKIRNNILRYDEFMTVQDLVDKYEGESLEVIPGIGPKSVEEIKFMLREYKLIN